MQEITLLKSQQITPVTNVEMHLYFQNHPEIIKPQVFLKSLSFLCQNKTCFHSKHLSHSKRILVKQKGKWIAFPQKKVMYFNQYIKEIVCAYPNRRLRIRRAGPIPSCKADLGYTLSKCQEKQKNFPYWHSLSPEKRKAVKSQCMTLDKTHYPCVI